MVYEFCAHHLQRNNVCKHHYPYFHEAQMSYSGDTLVHYYVIHRPECVSICKIRVNSNKVRKNNVTSAQKYSMTIGTEGRRKHRGHTGRHKLALRHN